MGWNSYDAYGLTVTEAQYKANAKVLADLRTYGWQYAVIDEGWFLQNPQDAEHPETLKYTLDANGRLTPALNRFPSAAGDAGFVQLANFTHSLGLKFGIHIIRGIPKEAVRNNLPIAGSSYHASDVADTSDTCPWNPDNYGVKDSAAGQAWYDSLVTQYAHWGVDFLKVDCIADHPYKAGEIRMIDSAIQKTGRPIVLSLSPGPTGLDHAAEVAEHAQLTRIADDMWDGWTFPNPQGPDNGLLSAFDNLAKWAPYARPGFWPDADMLPWGSLTPHPGSGPPRQSRLTQDEQRTQFTLWAIARSPLILGMNLIQLDEFNQSLITNKELITLNQTVSDSHPVTAPSGEGASNRIWIASTTGPKPKHYLAVFNLASSRVKFSAAWRDLGLSASPHNAMDVWAGKLLSEELTTDGLSIPLAPHGCVLLRIE